MKKDYSHMITIFIGILTTSLILFLPNGTEAKYVKLKTGQGIKIDGVYLEYKEPSPSLLILPGLSGSYELHEPFARELNRSGFTVLAIDYRYVKRDDLMYKMHQKEGPIPFINEEVSSAFNFLKRQEKVDSKRIGMIGLSYGTLLAPLFAEREKDIKALVLVSPITTGKRNPQLQEAVLKCEDRAFLFLASENDLIRQNQTNAAENARYWFGIVKGPSDLKIFPGDAHSFEMFKNTEVKKVIIDWFKKHL